MKQVLTAMIKAHEIQGCLAVEKLIHKVGLDHVVLVKVASTADRMPTARIDRNANDQCTLACKDGKA